MLSALFLFCVYANAQPPENLPSGTVESGAVRFGVAGFDSIAANPVEYRKVLDKFVRGVDRPTITDCIIAYYGFAAQAGFVSDADGPSAAERAMQQAILDGDFKAAYSIGNQILELVPVSLSALYWALHAATEIREPWEVRNSLKGRYNNLCYTISRSGLGLDADSAMKVIFVGDMYTYVTQNLGLTIGEGYLWDGRWTELEVTPGPKFKHPSIFFEVLKGPPATDQK